MKLFLLIIPIILFFNPGLAQDNNPFFLITVDGKRGFIDKNGTVVIEPNYENVALFTDGLAPVKINGKWGFINKFQKIIIEPRFDEIRWSFHEDLASVRVGEKWGYIDKTGTFIIAPNLDYGHLFYEGRAIINIGKGKVLPFHRIIDKSGKLIKTQLFEWSGWEYNEGLLEVEINGKWGFIDHDGKMTIPAKYKDAHSFSEGLAAVEFDDGWGFIDKKGNVVIPAQFGEAWYFKEGLAVVSKGLKSGFINKQGKTVIELKFNQAYSFSEGLAAVQKDRKWGFINQSGQFIVEPQYDDVWSYQNGLAGVAIGEWKPGTVITMSGRLPVLDAKWGYIDKTGKLIWKPTK